jgi:probable HAF family extracellular repeat protein
MAVAVLTTACVDPSAPNVEDALSVPSAHPSVVHDATATEGNPHFVFVPPTVPTPAPPGGSFDSSLLDELRVQVCPSDRHACGGEPDFVYTAEGPSYYQRIRLDRRRGHYVVYWPTGTAEAGWYRVEVLASDRLLGYLQVAVGQAVPVGTWLPVAFRVEEGALEFPLPGEIGPDGGTTVVGDGAVSFTIPRGAVSETVQINATPTTLPEDAPPHVGGTVWDFGPDGLVFDRPVTVSLQYDPALIPPGVDEAELRIHKLVDGEFVEQEESAIDTDRKVATGLVESFSVFALMEVAARDVGTYETLNLGTLGGTESFGLFVNDAGQVVGLSLTASGDTHAFLWEDGVMTDLGSLGSPPVRPQTNSPGRGLGSGGHVVGTSLVSPGSAEHAFLWYRGSMTDLGPRPSSLWVNGSGAVVSGNQLWRDGSWSTIPMDRGVAINDAGVIAGRTEDRLQIWDGVTLVDGGNLAPGFIMVYGINEAGQVIGRSSTTDPAPGFPGTAEQRAFLWADGVMHDLGSLGGRDLRASQPYDLNEAGEVVGSSVTVDGHPRAFHWRAGTMAALDLLSGDRSTASSINDAGQIVGWEWLGTDLDSSRALLWQTGIPYDLGTLGGVTATARWINESGWIVGTSRNTLGQDRATLWRPTPP